jgi:hypothetical protein
MLVAGDRVFRVAATAQDFSLASKHGIYRLTRRGIKAMWPAVRFRRIDFPAAYNAA